MNQLTIGAVPVDDVVKEIEEAFFDIPFENSQFQTEQFVINAQLTPERAYRAIGLRMMNRLRALQEAKFKRMREDIDIEELQDKLASDSCRGRFDKRRLELDIAEKLSHRAFTDKLINDAIVELNVLYQHFKRLPRYSRKQFEAAEGEYFVQSLNRQLSGIVGAAESLANMQQKNPALSFDNQESTKAIENGTRKPKSN